MSVRRFVAYFLAIVAGSTFAFASTLRGQPTPTEESTSEDGQLSMITDADEYVMTPESARRFHYSWSRHSHAPAGTARAVPVR